MVMLSSTRRGRVLRFHTEALPPNTLLVAQLDGREAISRLYRFDLELCAIREDLDPTALFAKPAYVAIKRGVVVRGSDKPGVQTVRIHGMLAQFEQGRKGREWVSYRAVLVPRLWNLSLARGSRIFQDKTVPEIVEAVLKDNGLTSEDYEFRTSGRSYPKREYVVQYQESDLDFIQRLCEHDGIFYVFRQEEEREKVVFGDSAAAYSPVVVPTAVAYNPVLAVGGEGGGGIDEWLQPECVRKFALQCSVVPKEVVLRDYNWRTPGVDLKVAAPVVPHGRGTHYEYGEHYKDAAEGKALASVRAEEWKCRERVFPGRSDAKTFHAGCTFDLTDHYRADFNRTYLLTKVQHQAEQTFEPGSAFVQRASYTNEFTAIPADLVFRPERTTPKPRVTGTVNARVDAAGSGEYAEIDDQGRYKVQIPFHLSTEDGGKASRFIRMAQPYAGGGMGMHFPLHKGTEVILTHVNGDPDRPVIAGAVPNPETGSPVTGGNNAQCVIQTGGNNKLVIDDDVGRMTLSTPTDETSISIGAAASPPGCRVRTNANILFDSAKDYIRHTCADVKEETLKNEFKIVHGNSAKEVHGNSRAWTKGDDRKEVVGDSLSIATGKSESFFIGKKFSQVEGESDDRFFGKKTSHYRQHAVEIGLSTKRALTVGASAELKGSLSTSTTVGLEHKSLIGGAIVVNAGKLWELTKLQKKLVTKEFKEILSLRKSTANNNKMEALQEIVLKCGASEIKMTPGGIEIKASKITVNSTGNLWLIADLLNICADGDFVSKGNLTNLK